MPVLDVPEIPGVNLLLLMGQQPASRCLALELPVIAVIVCSQAAVVMLHHAVAWQVQEPQLLASELHLFELQLPVSELLLWASELLLWVSELC